MDAAYVPSRLRALFLTEKSREEKNKQKTWLPRLNLGERGVRETLILDSTRWPVYRLASEPGKAIDW